MTVVRVASIVLQQYTIRNLETFTQYLVSLQVFNPAGRGPAVVVPVMTDEGGMFLWWRVHKPILHLNVAHPVQAY